MEERLIEIVADILQMDKKDVSMELVRENEEKWDSLAHVQLVTEIENEFNCEIGFDEVDDIKSVKDFLKYINGEN
ncbi:acyl carrier protein [Anaerosacchariphilus polymeriproducens]|uniref:Acyl carrier protein n=1 Tax=Anaerosacchariphilus polymeriproducens TaxID=1812858 RepID=A0A371ARA4_9FIRM|nr:acyl carrier protein [Anaerosacchariphilus polymeriproducens]RDU22111.1 acyl carrier protein [Anaerosacchariphilus polymeriproducens]